MHIVYCLTFESLKSAGKSPFKYVGSKSNCKFDGINIINERGNPYYGSSGYKDYKQIVHDNEISVEILSCFDDYKDALKHEKEIQMSLDVVASPEYFNLSIAAYNNFTDPEYATYKHTDTGKTVRLKRDHELVKSGVYVGVSSGAVFTEDERKIRGRTGEKNGFYGNTHSEETKRLISESNTGNKRAAKDIEVFTAYAKLPKSDEHKAKIGRKGMIMLKSIETHQTIRIRKEEASKYNLDVWMNPVRANKFIKEKDLHCNKNLI